MRTVLLIFGELSDQDIDWFSATGKKQNKKTGDVLIQKDVPIDALYIVLTGEFSVWIDDQREVSRAGSGEMLGEMSLIEARPPGATVKAATSSDVLAVPKKQLQDKLRMDAPFAARFYKALGMLLSFRLRRLTHAVHGREEEADNAAELDGNILDTVFLAGARFDRMLKKLS